MDDSKYGDGSNPAHDRLRKNPTLWGTVGITQTLLTSGVIFGWASLLPVIKMETSSSPVYTPEQFSLIFTMGGIGNYMTTLIFGIVLDNLGPRKVGMIASVLFSIGLVLCSFVKNYYCFSVGFFLLGFAGPGIQMPTLHLANLFPSKTGGTGAFYMSAQAAAFDGGTAIFALFRLVYQMTDGSFTVSNFFLMYNIVPVWCFLTSMFVWPDEILETPDISSGTDDVNNLIDGINTAMVDADADEAEEYVGAGSPYLSSKSRSSIRASIQQSIRTPPSVRRNLLLNAPLSVILKHPSFWALATWAGIHILKLNFIVATINDQLEKNVPIDVKDHLIDILGAMLPFGFVALPLVASILDREPFYAFELANVIGVLYGTALAFYPGSSLLQCFIVFPSVACSRQLVYSTLFHQVGASFGFANYGVLLGLINVMVSAFSTIQTPLVQLSESNGSYYLANLLLLIVTFPLLFTVLFSDPNKGPNAKVTKAGSSNKNEKSSLLHGDDGSRSTGDRKSVV